MGKITYPSVSLASGAECVVLKSGMDFAFQRHHWSEGCTHLVTSWLWHIKKQKGSPRKHSSIFFAVIGALRRLSFGRRAWGWLHFCTTCWGRKWNVGLEGGQVVVEISEDSHHSLCWPCFLFLLQTQAIQKPKKKHRIVIPKLFLCGWQSASRTSLKTPLQGVKTSLL